MREIEKIAEIEAAADHCTGEDLLDTFVAQRNHPYSLLLAKKGGRAHLSRKISDSCASLRRPQRKRQPNSQEMDIFGTAPLKLLANGSNQTPEQSEN